MNLIAARRVASTARSNALKRYSTYNRVPMARITLLHQSPSPQLALRRLHHYHGVQVRTFSWSTLPKFAGKLVRVPAALGSAVVGGAAYVNYKVQEVHSYTTGKFHEATEWLSDSYNSAKEALQSIELPDFSLGEFGSSPGQKKESQKDEGGGEPGGNGEDATVAGAMAAAAAMASRDQEDGEDQIMLLTKKMIEIRSILQRVDQSDTLQLPSIVVIGSQSSGKSSVLEAIVGHEFLPKGTNMVTRRPIELTLVNTPDSAAEFGEFPALGLGKITDFTQIQRTLTDLNLAVPETEAVSDDPIQLHIYSPHVPDLTMIDLPGYIQVAASDQPGSLKQKINSLCEKYIQPPNVILAISAADVDLANSSALRASRRVDPRGERTIGVITKMDLVNPSRGVDILENQNYPLQMGYVGVITKTPSPTQGVGFFRRGLSSSITSLVAQNESNYFGQHGEYRDCTVGTLSLRSKLMSILDKTMASSLQPTADAIHQELEEASYQFKVEYNDRTLTPQTYLAGSVDAFKLAFKDLTTRLGRNEVKKILKCEFDQRVLDLLAQRYWNKPYEATRGSIPNEPPLCDLPNAKADDMFWHRKLDASTSSLTKLGVGRLSTNLVINTLSNEMERLVDSTNFRNHPFAREVINEATDSILNVRYYSTADQVENCIKPYKYEVEVEDREWATSRDHAYNLLKEELRQCDDSYNSLRRTIGSSKLSQVMKFIENSRKSNNNNNNNNNNTSAPVPPVESEAFAFSQGLIAKGREAIFLRDRSDILKMRMAAVKSRQCRNKENKYYCPEVFLDVVADKLTQTAVLFLNVELLSDFYYNFPRELDNKLVKNLTEQQIEAFAKEDSRIKSHIELQQRKELLELALNKIEGVMELEKSRTRENADASDRYSRF
ncbi:dynamin-like GTPase Mgm1p, mitochondrial [Trichomonascus vanleenenianus]|uniref:dynamin-related GTPase MGM1 n=1 Tax=Trichomonascus vanleenenianus TaxID=2268995 RepID=UPI003ECA93C4